MSLDRRHLLTGAVVAGASELTVTRARAFQPAVGAEAADAIFGAIERHRAAYAALVAALKKNVPDLGALDTAEAGAFYALVDTVPMTLRGTAALIAYVREHRRERPEVVGELQDRIDATLLAALDRITA